MSDRVLVRIQDNDETGKKIASKILSYFHIQYREFYKNPPDNRSSSELHLRRRHQKKLCSNHSTSLLNP